MIIEEILYNLSDDINDLIKGERERYIFYNNSCNDCNMVATIPHSNDEGKPELFSLNVYFHFKRGRPLEPILFFKNMASLLIYNKIESNVNAIIREGPEKLRKEYYHYKALNIISNILHLAFIQNLIDINETLKIRGKRNYNLSTKTPTADIKKDIEAIKSYLASTQKQDKDFYNYLVSELKMALKWLADDFIEPLYNLIQTKSQYLTELIKEECLQPEPQTPIKKWSTPLYAPNKMQSILSRNYKIEVNDIDYAPYKDMAEDVLLTYVLPNITKEVEYGLHGFICKIPLDNYYLQNKNELTIKKEIQRLKEKLKICIDYFTHAKIYFSDKTKKTIYYNLFTSQTIIQKDKAYLILEINKGMARYMKLMLPHRELFQTLSFNGDTLSIELLFYFVTQQSPTNNGATRHYFIDKLLQYNKELEQKYQKYKNDKDHFNEVNKLFKKGLEALKTINYLQDFQIVSKDGSLMKPIEKLTINDYEEHNFKLKIFIDKNSYGIEQSYREEAPLKSNRIEAESLRK